MFPGTFPGQQKERNPTGNKAKGPNNVPGEGGASPFPQEHSVIVPGPPPPFKSLAERLLKGLRKSFKRAKGL